MIDIKNKVAIVTGGAASIGAAISTALHAAGAKVVVASRTQEEGESFVARLGDRAIFQRTDVSSDADLDALVKRAIDEFGSIDIIVNNAAIVAELGMQSARAQWAAMFDINVFSMAMLVQKALPYLQKSKGASIVNIGSCTAEVGITGLTVYPATKAAIHELTRCMAVELAPLKIRANVVAPGATMSDPINALVGGKREIADEAVAPVQPLGRLVNAEEVAQAVLFLASDLSSFTSGAVLAVDGGYGAMGPEARVSVSQRLMEAVAGKTS